MTEALVHGLLLAIGLILPLGPQNAFVLSQGASQPTLWRALPVVATAGCCDTTLIVLAVLGVSAVVAALGWLQAILVVGGVVFLLVMGWLTWRSPPPDMAAATGAAAGRRVAYAVAISLGNPHAVVDTIGVIGTSSLAYAGAAKLAFTGACVAVSWLWFLGLAAAGRAMARFEPLRRLLNPLSAVVMWASAAYLAASLF
ncbi:MAG TPA: LysE family transporter [Magnetospirillum sp.]|nr:LysE family transporter [Magnetospirillum sp.]